MSYPSTAECQDNPVCSEAETNSEENPIPGSTVSGRESDDDRESEYYRTEEAGDLGPVVVENLIIPVAFHATTVSGPAVGLKGEDPVCMMLPASHAQVASPVKDVGHGQSGAGGAR